jgi:hypothetical protein
MAARYDSDFECKADAAEQLSRLENDTIVILSILRVVSRAQPDICIQSVAIKPANVRMPDAFSPYIIGRSEDSSSVRCLRATRFYHSYVPYQARHTVRQKAERWREPFRMEENDRDLGEHLGRKDASVPAREVSASACTRV